MVTGDHPQSYSQPASSIRLFSKPRRSIATTTLQRQIGIVSPELFNAFPRRLPGLSLRDAIATGFDSTFAFRARTSEEEARLDEITSAFDFGLGKAGDKEFALLNAGEQALTLLMRALVSKAPLLILDEVGPCVLLLVWPDQCSLFSPLLVWTIIWSPKPKVICWKILSPTRRLSWLLTGKRRFLGLHRLCVGCSSRTVLVPKSDGVLIRRRRICAQRLYQIIELLTRTAIRILVIQCAPE